ncbi:MAG: bifunctional YncE family protein/alkaline phosphatase family protein [Marmoricola sp.]
MKLKRVLGRAGHGPRVTQRRRGIVAAASAGVILTTSGVAVASTLGFGNHTVGSTNPDGSIQISSDQVIKPFGERMLTPFGKFMGSTVSPNGQFLAETSMDRSVAVQVFDLTKHALVGAAGTASTATFQTAATNAGVGDVAASFQHITDGSVGQGNPVFSPDGKYLWTGVQDGLNRYPVNADGTLGAPTLFSLPKSSTITAPLEGGPVAASALPAGMAYGTDGNLYVALNGQNTVVQITNPTTAPAVATTWKVGIAPRQVAFVGGKLYVSNEGGRPANPGEQTMDSYGTAVPANGTTGSSTTGSVSVIDPTNTSPTSASSIAVGLHPTALYPRGTGLYVANTADDTVSVIDTASNKVVQTIDTRPWAGSPVGYQPDSLTIVKNHLLVSLGRANALEVFGLDTTPQAPVRQIGLIPTDYFPSGVFADDSGRVVVANRRGIDSRGPKLTTNQGINTIPATGHATHATTASVTWFSLPADSQIKSLSSQVFAQNGWSADRLAPGTAGGPIPTVLGGKSPITHVFLIVKENRTYDQMFGDMPQGNGDLTLAQFGREVTPNNHALATQFGLYDNTYDIGTNSAEGHNWMMQGDNPEYTESSAGEYQRSYDTEEDVLGHQRSGFIWSAIRAAGKSARNYGEFLYPEGKPNDPATGKPATWQQYYCATQSGDYAQMTQPALLGNYTSVIPSLNAITYHPSPPFDLSIPDIYREKIWQHDFQARGPAAFNMIWYSNDHTSGQTSPEAGVADNDLALGRTIDAISHSKYWKSSVIFVAEDDSQAGVDHVDGHRAPIQVISPWAVHHKVVDTYFSQISMVRTIEQILGAKPLNEKVAAATPMYAAFSKKPNYTPYRAVANQVPLTEGLTGGQPACGNDTRMRPLSSAAVPAAAQPIAAAWTRWVQAQTLTGRTARADSAHPALLNRYDWYMSHRFVTPYPGDKKVYLPSQVPGGNVPSADTD